MSRLWSRTGLRVLSILVLLFGLVGGAYVSNDAKNRSHASAADQLVSVDQTQLAPAQALTAAQAPLRAAYGAAQAVAQQRATAAAASASVAAQKAQDAARRSRAAAAASRSQTRTTPAPTPTASTGPAPKSCSDYTGNRAIGCSLLVAAGFAIGQMSCLDKMWTRESNWRTTAENQSSGSYGIPQALPASKMATFGADYRTNPATQIKWGLDYITKRYTTPCGAWAFWQSHNWY